MSNLRSILPPHLELVLEGRVKSDLEKFLVRIIEAFCHDNYHRLEEQLLEFERTRVLPGTELRIELEKLIPEIQLLVVDNNDAKKAASALIEFARRVKAPK